MATTRYLRIRRSNIYINVISGIRAGFGVLGGNLLFLVGLIISVFGVAVSYNHIQVGLFALAALDFLAASYDSYTFANEISKDKDNQSLGTGLLALSLLLCAAQIGLSIWQGIMIGKGEHLENQQSIDSQKY